MNDEILQHHFDEVFNALQDQENFEIFTGLKQVKQPRVKKTLVKIVRPSALSPPDSSTDPESLTSAFSLVSASTRMNKNNPEGSGREKSSNSIAGKLYFMPPHEERKKMANRNTLFECKYCGRYVLGDFLSIHEERCGNESLSYRIQ